MGKFIDDELNLLAIDRHRYNARSISGHASDIQQMPYGNPVRITEKWRRVD
jgi:hypothetical protein